MDESKAREARNKRANKLKIKRKGKLSGELGLETNETAYIDGGIITTVHSSSSISVAIDTSKLHGAQTKRFKSNACTGVIADFTSGRINSDDVPTPPELEKSSDVVLQNGDENLSYRHSNSTEYWDLGDANHNCEKVVYTVEFQKRGLPHAHILLFLAAKDRFPTGVDIDTIISAEILDVNIYPAYYVALGNFMIHGPCGVANKNAPCMSENECTKFFPKEFVDCTTFSDEGYPIYRRRDTGRIIMKNGVPIDNRFVVPHICIFYLKCTGKTFIWRTLSVVIRSKGDVVLYVASCGIASLLLPRAHYMG
ncbi:hypothetical protein OROMI_010879 [Orobanche minor]